MTTSARFEFRIPADAKERIEAAAALTNETASDFARSAAISRANEILSRQERTVLPADFFDALLRELDNPPVPNDRFVRAAKLARNLLGYGDQG